MKDWKKIILTSVFGLLATLGAAALVLFFAS